ncbi:MAG TPA: carbon-nitrogen hydrolase family protein [Bacillota bacterium]|jgi:predicted amidohydrolase|nr:carbon-nitrogen hydrolase family protein [Fastidiosipila sp.]HPX93785.1 carbon-nitrogen hydrolase family protein [Bacillota bacterium]HQB81610.1 carbon-nitrogen hydrolase family protein [Bacillota bacterium]
MNDLIVALLQLMPEGSLQANLNKGLRACREARAMGADLALFPEMWSNGYHIPQEENEFRRYAISNESPFLAAFAGLAQELQMAIAITYLEACEPSPRNTVRLFDRNGRAALTYAKVHLCFFDEDEGRLTSGDDFYVCELDTEKGPVRIGAMICYDREFPESARILMLKGAEIILVPNACPMEINRISQLRARAFENMTGVATANYPQGWPDCNGHSNAFDGMAYKPGEPSSRDTLILEAGEEEGIFLAAFPLDQMRAYRESEVHGNAYRQPGKYSLLLSEIINAPFIREERKS